MISSSKEYVAPSWAWNSVSQSSSNSTNNNTDEKQESQEFSLEVLKSGQIIETIHLPVNNGGKSFYIFGRQSDAVDVVMEHPSLSRQHAILQYRNDGALMLLDYKSAQGTYLNKELVSSETYSRVYVGDMIKFGASTRLYIVNGPESHRLPEYDSENMKLYREKLQQKSKAADKQMNDGISWGFQEDAPYEDEDYDQNEKDDDKRSNLPRYLREDENYERKYGDLYSVEDFISSYEKAMIKLAPKPAEGVEKSLSDADLKLIEKLRATQLKIQNIEQETRRIYMKESTQGELTEGQIAAVSRNDERIRVLTESNDELISIMKNKLAGGNYKSATDKRNRNDLEDESLYDTTAVTANSDTNWRLRKKQMKTGQKFDSIFQIDGDSSTSQKPASNSSSMTYEDLCLEKSRFLKAIDKLKQEKIRHEETQLTLERELIEDKNDKAVDDMDLFLLEEKVKQAKYNLEKCESHMNDLEKKLKQIDRLIEITKPALMSLIHK